MWRELSKLPMLKLPRLVIGDFNTIRSMEEHRGVSFNNYASKFIYFNYFICFNNLFYLVFLVSPFTWCNGQSGSAHLGIFLAKMDWLDLFEFFVVEHLQCMYSDHALFSLKTRLRFILKRKFLARL